MKNAAAINATCYTNAEWAKITKMSILHGFVDILVSLPFPTCRIFEKPDKNDRFIYIFVTNLGILTNFFQHFRIFEHCGTVHFLPEKC